MGSTPTGRTNEEVVFGLIIPGSFNGRTTASDAVYGSSNLSPGTAEEEIPLRSLTSKQDLEAHSPGQLTGKACVIVIDPKSLGLQRTQKSAWQPTRREEDPLLVT